MGLEVWGVVEVRFELFGRFLRVDEASDCVGRVGDEKWNEMATLLAVGGGKKDCRLGHVVGKIFSRLWSIGPMETV